MRKRAWFLAAVAAFVPTLASATNVSGAITKNTTWALSGSPYVVTGTVTVNSGKTLTVAAGVSVKFNTATSLTINGKLTAVGTAGSPILFTSSAVTPAPGNWGSINFMAGSSAGSQISYATVEYGGWGGGGINVYGGAPTLDHSTIRNFSGHGVYVSGTSSTPALSFATVATNGGSGVYLDSGGGVNVTDTSLTGNTAFAMSAVAGTRVLGLTNVSASGNAGGNGNAIAYRGGTIGAAETWRAGLPWALETASVAIASAGTLTVSPGAVVKLGASRYIDVTGVLTAVGTSGSPITFTSSASSPTPGSWGCITFNSGSSASRLAYATVQYGGNSSVCYSPTSTSATNAAAIRVYAGTPTFDHLTVSNSGNSGFYVSGSTTTPAMSFLTLSGNTRNGIFLETAGGVTLTDSSITGNGQWAISTLAATRILGLTNMTVSGNGAGTKDAIEHRGGSAATSETWRAGMAWVITAGYSTQQTLTVQAGATVKMASNIGISATSLSAVGTASNPIVFTSSLASPTPGSWTSLYLSGASQLSYASVLYGGQGGGPALTLGAATPVDHLTVSSSGGEGLRVTGNGVTITASTIANNAGIGIRGFNTYALSNSSITGNGAWAVTAENGSYVTGLTGMTVSGNGGSTPRDAIQTGGSMSGSQTWASGMTWVIDPWLTVAAADTWTIQPGTLIKVTSGQITVDGVVTAVGTPASPIIFTSAAASPAPGNWLGIRLKSSASRLSYASVSYGGASFGTANVYVQNCSPVLDHVIIASSQRHGLVVEGYNPGPIVSFATFSNNVEFGVYVDSSIFTIQNSTFVGNGREGIYNLIAGYPVTAKGCYWSAADGPSGVGPGSGQGVTANVFFEPWLIEPPTDVDYFTGFTVTNQTFNPAIGAQASVSFSSSLVGNWAATIVSSGGFTVRTFSGHGSTGAFTWDGNDGSGQALPGGIYRYTLATTADGGAVAARAQGRLIVDLANQLTLTNVVVSPLFFSPNGDGVQDTTLLTATTNYATANWTVTVKNGGGATVRTATGTGTAISFTWDGRNGSGVLQPDGSYTQTVVVTLGVSAVSSSPMAVTLDVTLPTAAITSPAPSAVLSNVYQNGSTSVVVRGTSNDLNFLSWTLDYGSGAAPASWSTLMSWYYPVTDQPLATWATGALPNGTYTLRLVGRDQAGNASPAALATVTVGNFSASQPAYQFNPASGQTHTYTSVVPFTLTETLVLKNRNGQVVRTLVNASRGAGTYLDAWNGRGDGGQLLPDGPYFYVVTVTDGTSTLVWDRSNQFLSGQGWNDNLSIQPFDPFNNQPMTFTYQFASPGVISIGFAQSYPVWGGCIPPEFCLIYQEYQESGPHTVHWGGVDSTGAYRSDVRSVGVTIEWDKFAQNAVVVYGSKPQLSGITVTPAVFGPAVGTQAVSFDVGSYLNQPVDVSVSFLNQSSLSTLRTVSAPQQAPGHVVIPWDGRADNGMLVAPGRYTVTVVVSDSLGSQVRGQILTVIQY